MPSNAVINKYPFLYPIRFSSLIPNLRFLSANSAFLLCELCVFLSSAPSIVKNYYYPITPSPERAAYISEAVKPLAVYPNHLI
jgi:hypothetical protein